MDIHVRFAQGQSIRKIARELGISRNTAKHHVRGYSFPTYAAREKKQTKLAPFKPYLIHRIKQAKPDWIPATVLFDEIAQRGYQGGIAQLRRFVSQFKPHLTPEPIIRFETAPGQQMQIDFTTIRRSKPVLKAFVATLGYSRACYVKFFDNERAPSWQQGLKEAFDYFGGVPKQVLCDNAKALIVERDAYGCGEHKLHCELFQMSKDYGFKLTACKPYRAKTKGKVERFNHYLKNSFIVPLKATLRAEHLDLDVQIANAKIGSWLHRVAHQRCHGTTMEKPAERLIDEVKYLKPLPNLMHHACLPANTANFPIVPPYNSLSLQHTMQSYEALLGGSHVTS